MKKFFLEFIKRGLMAAAGGPMVLAIVYGSIGATGAVTALTPKEVCLGILTITVMAFIAAGITAIYQTDRLPLISAILVHSGVLYLDYLMIYLVNRWIPRNPTAIAVFSGIFAMGFALVWMIVYLCIKAKTDQINKNRNETH